MKYATLEQKPHIELYSIPLCKNFTVTKYIYQSQWYSEYAEVLIFVSYGGKKNIQTIAQLSKTVKHECNDKFH